MIRRGFVLIEGEGEIAGSKKDVISKFGGGRRRKRRFGGAKLQKSARS